MQKPYLTVHFHRPELEWLQSNLQQTSEEKDNNLTAQEHAWILDFLMKVRLELTHPTIPIVFLCRDQVNFIKKTLTDYKNNAGAWEFQGGPYGNNIGEGGQFPSLTGSANSNFSGQGAFPEDAFVRSGNIFNDVLHVLGDVIYPPLDPVVHSPGGF